MPDSPPWETVSFVLSSEVRTRILEFLKRGESTPSQISRSIGQPLSHVSRALKELQSRELVELLTPQRTKARLYRATQLGVTISAKVTELREGRKA